MTFMDVQVKTRGYIPMINRRGPITNITLDIDTINQLIADGVELCDPETGDPICKVWVEETETTPVVKENTIETEETGVGVTADVSEEETPDEPVTEVVTGEEVPSTAEDTDDDADEPEPAAVDGIPPYVYDPKLSKNQNKKAKREYYAKVRAAMEQK